jgi:hypothetical protein
MMKSPLSALGAAALSALLVSASPGFCGPRDRLPPPDFGGGRGGGSEFRPDPVPNFNEPPRFELAPGAGGGPPPEIRSRPNCPACSNDRRSDGTCGGRVCCN